MSAAMPLPLPLHDTLAVLCWPVTGAGAALEELARRAGLCATADGHGRGHASGSGSGAGAVPATPPGLGLADPDTQARWMDWAASRLGLEAEAVATPLGGLEDLLRQAAPALLLVQDTGSGQPGLLLLLKGRGRKLQLIGTDLALHRVSAAQLSEALCAPLQAPYGEAMEHLLNVAEVPETRRASTRGALLREHLAAQPVCSCWLLRAAPGAPFWQQVRRARLPHKLLGMLLAFAAVYGAEIAGWALVGNITLGGHLDLGWLAAWGLLVLSLIPLHLLGGWLDARFALEMGRMLKTRLLAGILQSDLDLVRKQGAGQLLSRVMESQALESLAVNGGMGVLIALLELGIAAVVLASGAGGHWHVLLLGLWLLLSLALSWRFFRRLRHWTLMRLDLTHALVERMVGHRTRLAQERPWRRDEQEDLALRDYLDASQAMDYAIVPAAAIMPRGWMLLGLVGLLPAFVAGSAQPGALAVALGGMLLANRALMGVSAGLAALSRAAVAWSQVASLFGTQAPARGNAPFLARAVDRATPESTAHAGPPAAAGTHPAGPATPAGARHKVVDASQLRFGYGAAGDALLNGLDLTIYSGEQILLEGPSGGGKSTLASLLVGLRQPHSGLLLLNGLDRHTLGASWHQLATEAPQFHENHILSGTLAYNLLMGRNWPASAIELQEAKDLCEELGLGPLLQRMPSGLVQMVGETGWQLSHGERSRIFLARALLQQAELTVLDESFAALDPQTLEQCLLCALQRSRALLVVAHP